MINSRTQVYLLLGVVVAFSLISIMFLKSFTGHIVWMKEGEKLDILANGAVYEVQLFDVAGENRTDSLCGFLVDGEHIWIEEGHHNELHGLKIYVRKAVLVRDQLQDKDICKVAFAGVIIKVNESSAIAGSEEGLQEENISSEESSTSETSREPEDSDVYVEVLDEVEGEEEIDVIEEKPAKTGLFQRIMLWLKSIF